MATAKQLANCVKALLGIETAVADTFVSQTEIITNTLTETHGAGNWEIEKTDIEAMIDGVAEKATWSGTSSERARKTDYRAIIRGYPFLKDACKTFRDTYYNGTDREGEKGPLGREHVLKIARLAPDSADADTAATLAIDHFIARDKAAGNGAASQQDKLIAGLKQAHKNAKGSAMLADLETFLKKHKLYKAVTK